MKILPRITPSPLFFIYKLGAKIAFSAARYAAVHHKNVQVMRRSVNLLGNKTIKPVQLTLKPFAGMDTGWFSLPKTRSNTLIMYCHGGGFCTGSIRSHARVCSLVVKATGCTLVNFNYRLAPEHAYPATIDDALTMYQALLAAGNAAHNIVLMGDSAGGSVAIALLQKLRDSKLPPPCCAVLLSPWLDFNLQSDSAATHSDPLLSKGLLQTYVDHAFTNASVPSHSLLDYGVDNFPPVFLQIGGADLLVDENRQLGDLLNKQNNGSVVEYWQDMPHVWLALHPFLKEAEASLPPIRQFIEQHCQQHDRA